MATAIIRTPQEAPDIAAARSLALETASIIAPELHRPRSHRLVRDDNAALQQHLLDQAKAQREAKVQPHRMRDDRSGNRWRL